MESSHRETRGYKDVQDLLQDTVITVCHQLHFGVWRVHAPGSKAFAGSSRIFVVAHSTGLWHAPAGDPDIFVERKEVGTQVAGVVQVVSAEAETGTVFHTR